MRSRSQNATFSLSQLFLIGVVAILALATSCASTITVGKKGENFYVYNNFQDCPGIQFNLTVTQNGKSTRATSNVAAGKIIFEKLKDIDWSNIVIVDLEISGTTDCPPFFVGKKYTTGPIVLEPARDRSSQPIKDEYVVDVGQFKEP